MRSPFPCDLGFDPSRLRCEGQLGAGELPRGRGHSLASPRLGLHAGREDAETAAEGGEEGREMSGGAGPAPQRERPRTALSLPMQLLADERPAEAGLDPDEQY